MKILVSVACVLVSLAASSLASAQTGTPRESPTATEAARGTTFDALDEAFGDYVVTPLSTFLFFDLVFWDNTDPRFDAWPTGLR